MATSSSKHAIIVRKSKKENSRKQVFILFLKLNEAVSGVSSISSHVTLLDQKEDFLSMCSFISFYKCHNAFHTYKDIG